MKLNIGKYSLQSSLPSCGELLSVASEPQWWEWPWPHRFLERAAGKAVVINACIIETKLILDSVSVELFIKLLLMLLVLVSHDLQNGISYD